MHQLFGFHVACNRRPHQIDWSEVHKWEREFIALLKLNVTLKET